MLVGLIAILGGLIAMSGFIISKKPNAQELLDKVTPYQGWIGVVLLVWGIWGLIASLLSISILSLMPIFWILCLAVALCEFVVGFLLAYGLISKYLLEKNEAAKAKGAALRGKLLKFQVPAGIVLVILGLLNIILRIVYFR